MFSYCNKLLRPLVTKSISNLGMWKHHNVWIMVKAMVQNRWGCKIILTGDWRSYKHIIHFQNNFWEKLKFEKISNWAPFILWTVMLHVPHDVWLFLSSLKLNGAFVANIVSSWMSYFRNMIYTSVHYEKGTHFSWINSSISRIYRWKTTHLAIEIFYNDIKYTFHS